MLTVTDINRAQAAARLKGVGYNNSSPLSLIQVETADPIKYVLTETNAASPHKGKDNDVFAASLPGGYQDVIISASNTELISLLKSRQEQYDGLIKLNSDGSIQFPLGSPKKQAPLLDLLSEIGYDVAMLQEGGKYRKFADTRDKAADAPSPDDVEFVALLEAADVEFEVETKEQATKRETREEALTPDSLAITIVGEATPAIITGRHMKNGVKAPPIPVMCGKISSAGAGEPILKSDGRIERPALLTLEEWKAGIKAALNAASPENMIDAIAVANKFNAALDIVSADSPMYDPASENIEHIDVAPYLAQALNQLNGGLDTVDLIYGNEMKINVEAQL